jgi:glutamine synthetase
VGGGQSIGGPLIALNVAVAESVDYIATTLEAAVSSGKPLNQAIQALLSDIYSKHGAVVFNGDGYSAEWHAEAEKRGLLNLKTTPEALAIFEKPETISLFEKYGVLSPRELHSRHDIYLEQYAKTVHVEAKLTTEIAQTQILPAALKYLAEIGTAVSAAKAAGATVELKAPAKVAKLAGELEASIDALETAAAHHGAKDLNEECTYLCSKVLPAMLKVRAAADSLETVVSDELWPLPTYQEMLFIR